MKNIFSTLKFILAVSLVFAASVTPSRADRYNKITPCRLVDTRAGASAALPTIKGAFANNEERVIPFRANNSVNCIIPPEATAVVINLTAVNPTVEGHIKIYPGNVAAPNVSNINFAPNSGAIANQAIVQLNPSGAPDTKLRASFATVAGTTDVIIDVNGYFAPTGARFHALPLCRLLDTRAYPTNKALLMPPNYTKLTAGQTITFSVQGCAIPSDAVAVFANLMAVNASGEGFFTIYPADVTRPTVSALNFQNGHNAIPNAVIVPLAAGTGELKLYSGASGAHAVLNITGYFQ
jgi:hypothetical protein